MPPAEYVNYLDENDASRPVSTLTSAAPCCQVCEDTNVCVCVCGGETVSRAFCRETPHGEHDKEERRGNTGVFSTSIYPVIHPHPSTYRSLIQCGYNLLHHQDIHLAATHTHSCSQGQAVKGRVKGTCMPLVLQSPINIRQPTSGPNLTPGSGQSHNFRQF